MRKGEVYKKMGVYRKMDKKHKYLKKKKNRSTKQRQEEYRERRVNGVAFCMILASSGKLMEEYMLLYSIKLTFSSVSSSSGKAPSCCSFLSLTNFIDLGQD